MELTEPDLESVLWTEMSANTGEKGFSKKDVNQEPLCSVCAPHFAECGVSFRVNKAAYLKMFATKRAFKRNKKKKSPAH